MTAVVKAALLPEGISEDFLENVVKRRTLIRERTLNGMTEIITTLGTTQRKGEWPSTVVLESCWESMVSSEAGKLVEALSRGTCNAFPGLGKSRHSKWKMCLLVVIYSAGESYV